MKYLEYYMVIRNKRDKHGRLCGAALTVNADHFLDMFITNSEDVAKSLTDTPCKVMLPISPKSTIKNERTKLVNRLKAKYSNRVNGLDLLSIFEYWV